MKAFKFKLDKVLDFRIDKESKLIEQLSAILKKYKNEKNKLDNLLEMENNTLLSLNNYKLRKIDIFQIKEHYSYLKYLRNNINFQHEIVKKFENEVAKKRSELIVARIDRKVIENLKEKKLIEYKYFTQKMEETMLEDIFNYSTK